jgi:hypothetical protein
MSDLNDRWPVTDPDVTAFKGSDGSRSSRSIAQAAESTQLTAIESLARDDSDKRGDEADVNRKKSRWLIGLIRWLTWIVARAPIRNARRVTMDGDHQERRLKNVTMD